MDWPVINFWLNSFQIIVLGFVFAILYCCIRQTKK
jgi:hypothetical protein